MYRLSISLSVSSLNFVGVLEYRSPISRAWWPLPPAQCVVRQWPYSLQSRARPHSSMPSLAGQCAAWLRSRGCVCVLLPPRYQLCMSHSHKQPLPPASFSWWWSFSQGSFLRQEVCFGLYHIGSVFLATSLCFSRSSRCLGLSLLTFLQFCFLILKWWDFQFISWARNA